MLRWTAVLGWMLCSLMLLQHLEARDADRRKAEVSRRVEHRVRLLGVEWAVTVRESPRYAQACPAGQISKPPETIVVSSR